MTVYSTVENLNLKFRTEPRTRKQHFDITDIWVIKWGKWIKLLREPREGRGSNTYISTCLRVGEGREACDTNGGKISQGLESNPETHFKYQEGKMWRNLNPVKCLASDEMTEMKY